MYSESVTSQTDSISTEDMAQEAVDTRSPQLASVNYLALDTIAAAITGAPFHDTEFAVAHKGRDQYLYAHSSVIRRACPVLFKMIQASPTVQLDSMELDGPGAVRPGGRSHSGRSTADTDVDSIVTADDEDQFSIAATEDGEGDGAATPTGRATPTGQAAPTATPTLPNNASLTSVSDASHSGAAAQRSQSSTGGRLTRLFRLRGGSEEESGSAPTPTPSESHDTSRLTRYSSREPVSAATRAPPTPSSASVTSQHRRSRRAHGQAPRPKGPLKRVRVLGVTPRSLQALLFYLYTSQAHFVASPNADARGAVSAVHEDAIMQLGDGSKLSPSLWPPAFADKAAYCLGRQLELDDLALRAYDHLVLNISSHTVLADLLSPFGDRFGEVRQAQLDYVSQHWDEVKTRPDFVPIINNLVQGQYPRSSASLLELFSKLSMR